MIRRRYRSQVEAHLVRTPAVALLGARQVGKTTLALEIAAARGDAAVYLDLERPADLQRLSDADAYLRSLSGRLVVIDEIQRVPDLFSILRGVIDERRRAGEKAGHFLLLGSASLELLQQASESLAGRVAYLELPPFEVLEAGGGRAETERLWNRGGFPESILASDDAASLAWRRSFVRSYLQRDVAMFAPRLPAETIGRLWTMLAHAQGSLLQQSRLASSLAVSAPAVARYLDLLVDLLLVRRLRPWSGNVGKRLVRSPKVYIRDSGLAHALLDLESLDDLLGHPVAGPSWEGFAIENLIGAAGESCTPYFYRTADGAEVDLVLERGGQVEAAIEIKRSTAPEVSKGFRFACDVLQPRRAYVVHGGEGSWPSSGGITAVGLAELAQTLASEATRHPRDE